MGCNPILERHCRVVATLTLTLGVNAPLVNTVLGFDQIGCACWIVRQDFLTLLDVGEFPSLFQT